MPKRNALGARLAELTAAETQHAQAIHEQEAEQDRLSQRIYSLDAELRQNQNVLNHTALEVDRSENRITFNQTRSAELAGRNEQIARGTADGHGAAPGMGIRGTTAQQQAVDAARTESVTVNARVEELATRAAIRATQITRIRSAHGSICAGPRREAGESLLRLHGEQKQAEEALVHQSESLQKQEAREAELLESSIRVRDDAEHAAQDLAEAP